MPYDSCCAFVSNFIIFFLKLIIIDLCPLRDSENVFIQFMDLCALCLFSMLSHNDIVNIERRDGTYWLIFVVDQFSRLFLHPSIFSILGMHR